MGSRKPHTCVFHRPPCRAAGASAQSRMETQVQGAHCQGWATPLHAVQGTWEGNTPNKCRGPRDKYSFPPGCSKGEGTCRVLHRAEEHTGTQQSPRQSSVPTGPTSHTTHWAAEQDSRTRLPQRWGRGLSVEWKHRGDRTVAESREPQAGADPRPRGRVCWCGAGRQEQGKGRRQVRTDRKVHEQPMVGTPAFPGRTGKPRVNPSTFASWKHILQLPQGSPDCSQDHAAVDPSELLRNLSEGGAEGRPRQCGAGGGRG